MELSLWDIPMGFSMRISSLVDFSMVSWGKISLMGFPMGFHGFHGIFFLMEGVERVKNPCLACGA